MKKWPLTLLAIVVVAGGAAYVERGLIRDEWDTLNAPVLPTAKPFESPLGSAVADPQSGVNDQPSAIEGGPSTSTHYTLISSPNPTSPPAPKVDPLSVNGPLPREINLAVPFTIQAPDQNWTPEAEESCEEASVLMVADYYKGMTGTIPVDQAITAIKQLIAYENTTFGDYKNTTAAQTGKMAVDFFKEADAQVIPISSADQIKRLLANGYPVIVPAAGRLLDNPNFTAPGPNYHMYVIKGYTANNEFITDEPGTRNGHDYLYSFSTVLNSMHDYNATDMTLGERVVLVLVPASR